MERETHLKGDAPAGKRSFIPKEVRGGGFIKRNQAFQTRKAYGVVGGRKDLSDKWGNKGVSGRPSRSKGGGIRCSKVLISWRSLLAGPPGYGKGKNKGVAGRGGGAWKVKKGGGEEGGRLRRKSGCRVFFVKKKVIPVGKSWGQPPHR